MLFAIRERSWLLAVTVFAPAALIAQPVALTVDLTGQIEPGVDLYGELESGRTYALADDAMLEFLHYPSCQTVIVQGGEVVFSAENFRVRGGRIVDVQRTRCPESIRLTAEGAVAALVVRGGDADPLRLGGNAAFIVVGAGAGRIERIRIRRGEDVLYAGPLAGRSFTWPQDRAPLAAGDDYLVELSGPDLPDGHSFQAEIDIRRGAGHIALVRVD